MTAVFFSFALDIKIPGPEFQVPEMPRRLRNFLLHGPSDRSIFRREISSLLWCDVRKRQAVYDGGASQTYSKRATDLLAFVAGDIQRNALLANVSGACAASVLACVSDGKRRCLTRTALRSLCTSFGRSSDSEVDPVHLLKELGFAVHDPVDIPLGTTGSVIVHSSKLSQAYGSFCFTIGVRKEDEHFLLTDDCNTSFLAVYAPSAVQQSVPETLVSPLNDFENLSSWNGDIYEPSSNRGGFGSLLPVGPGNDPNDRDRPPFPSAHATGICPTSRPGSSRPRNTARTQSNAVARQSPSKGLTHPSASHGSGLFVGGTASTASLDLGNNAKEFGKYAGRSDFTPTVSCRSSRTTAETEPDLATNFAGSRSKGTRGDSENTSRHDDRLVSPNGSCREEPTTRSRVDPNVVHVGKSRLHPATTPGGFDAETRRDFVSDFSPRKGRDHAGPLHCSHDSSATANQANFEPALGQRAPSLPTVQFASRGYACNLPQSGQDDGGSIDPARFSPNNGHSRCPECRFDEILRPRKRANFAALPQLGCKGGGDAISYDYCRDPAGTVTAKVPSWPALTGKATQWDKSAPVHLKCPVFTTSGYPQVFRRSMSRRAGCGKRSGHGSQRRMPGCKRCNRLNR